MLKFIKDNMATIDGIEIFPIISFLIFFTFFIAVALYVVKMKKSRIDELSNIPLEDGAKQ
ncbi:MAG: CcoQ/FixQ family Cbb3-type cytochrome c oxidase assembly chaperone [Flavobacteriales bacterium]|nr:CcoQ/FixQ family Cbb3-type cytochrome c oxidase assembly chaperone [Flavobacteriales bacterium]